MKDFNKEKSLLHKINWQKVNHLIPAIIQNKDDKQVLMLGYMNKEALKKTLETGLVTFYSRTKARLWTKGETSKRYLILHDISLDCDQDTLLIKAFPKGPTCHLGSNSCFHKKTAFENTLDFSFLFDLEQLISSRKKNGVSSSYTASLFTQGTKRIAQKVGEEGVEVALAAMTNDKAELLNESADLLYHLLVLLQDKDCTLLEVIDVLQKRNA